MPTSDSPLSVAPSRGLSLALGQAQAVIFQDDFNGQPDWHSGLPENDQGGLKLADNGLSGGWPVDIEQHIGTHTLPVGWNHVRQTPAFAPSRGYPAKHEPIEILASSTAENSNRTRSGTGKSVVMWRESTDDSWHNDKMLVKVLPGAYKQLYVEFYFNLSNEMIANYYDETVRDEQNMSKFFRAYCWDGIGGTFVFHDSDYYDHKVPYVTWGMEGRPEAKGGYGFRNGLSFVTRRTWPTALAGEDKFIDWSGNPAEKIGTSYHPNTTTSQGGVVLTDQLSGAPMDSNQFAIDIDQVFGPESNWVKMGFFMKLNSAPGVSDGVLKQWINDERIVSIETMQWVADTFEMPAGWTTIALGGNDFFKSYPASEAYEHWFAFDDLKVYSGIPEGLI